MSFLVSSVTEGLLHLVVVTILLGPLIWWTSHRHGRPVLGRRGWLNLGLAGVLYVIAHLVLRLPRIGPFADLQWNWQNKLLLVGLLVLFVSLSRTITWSEVGARLPRRHWWIPVLAVVATVLGLQILAGPLSQLPPTAEAAAFQAIMPGLDEELLFRGVLLVVLDHALRARRAMWRGQVGWSVPISCLLFGLAHGLLIENGFVVNIDPASGIASAVIGLLLVWVRIRWNSLWPAVLLHNGWNLSVVAANAL